MMGNGYDDGWMADGSWGFWVMCMLGLVLLVAVIALAVAVLWNRPQPPAPTPPRTERIDRSEALQVLERRYAAGDIDDDEFRRRRTLLDR
jgi:putative membrane protein